MTQPEREPTASEIRTKQLLELYLSLPQQVTAQGEALCMLYLHQREERNNSSKSKIVKHQVRIDGFVSGCLAHQVTLDLDTAHLLGRKLIEYYKALNHWQRDQ